MAGGRYILYVVALALWYSRHIVQATPIDNGVKGYPHVTCGVHSIRVDVDTEKPFQGRVFVKGESYNKDCIRSFAGAPAAPGPYPLPVPGPALVPQPGPYGEPPAPVPVPAAVVGGIYGETVGIELGFGQCNMRRQRTLFPRGVEYTFTLVVSFHSLFITKVDKAYRIRCFYMEAEKTVAQQLEVSMLTTHQVNEQFPMPQCRYHIRRGARDGPPVRFARVGEPVYHVWECDAPAAYLYGMLVKNCFVDDGQGNKVELIDERGCANDRHIIPDLTYDASLIAAFTESHVFKYADKPSLYFACTIVLCFKQDGGCNGITPPACAAVPVLPALPPVPYPAPAPIPLPPPVPLPVPGPYPAPVPVPLPVPAVVPYPAPGPVIVPAPVPVYRPALAPAVPVPYNRDSPLEDEKDNSTSLSSAATTLKITLTDNTVDLFGTPRRTNATPKAEKTFRRITDRRVKHKREITSVPTANHMKKHGIHMIETDLSAQPVVVLPFEENGGDLSSQEEDLKELQSMVQTSGPLRHSYAWMPIGNNGGRNNVCMSSSGFGIMVALFLALLLLSATMTALVIRRYMSNNEYRSKI